MAQTCVCALRCRPMADSEFGGAETTPHGVQPPPHVPTESERISLLYRTGDESGRTPPDDGSVWMGLRSEATQRAIRESEGVLAKGQVWETMRQEGEQAVGELPKAEGQ